MTKTYSIELDELDLGQLHFGLESWAEACEKTALYRRTDDIPNRELSRLKNVENQKKRMESLNTSTRSFQKFVNRWRQSHDS